MTIVFGTETVRKSDRLEAMSNRVSAWRNSLAMADGQGMLTRPGADGVL